jgi:hypothetical protein
VLGDVLEKRVENHSEKAGVYRDEETDGEVVSGGEREFYSCISFSLSTLLGK